MNIYRVALKQTNSSFLELTKSSWPIALGAVFVSEGFSQHFLHMKDLVGHTQWGLVSTQVGLVCAALLKTLVFLMLVPLRLREIDSKASEQESFWRFSSKQIMPLTIEGLRVMAFVILWSLLLILPGLFKQVRYYFVPFVVMLDEKYHAGEVDALKRSNDLIKPFTWSLFLFLALTLVFELGLEQYKQSFNIVSQAPQSLLLTLLAGLISFYIYAFLYRLYQGMVGRLEESENGTHI